MDLNTARLALQLQLTDVESVLKSLPLYEDSATHNEKAAFVAHREDLVRKWDDVQGQVFAYSILKEENNNRTVFRRLLDEERQAERAYYCVLHEYC